MTQPRVFWFCHRGVRLPGMMFRRHLSGRHARRRSVCLPRYDFILPEGRRSKASFDPPIEVGAAISFGGDLFRVWSISPNPDGESVRADLQPWPQKDPVLGRVFALPNA